MGAESFTILAILEARDRASEIFAKVDESLGRFSEVAKSAADTARGAGASIDDSLLQTASGADALDLAEARVSAAQARVAASTQAQADAERSLLGAQAAAAAGADDDAEAQGRLATASQALTAAQKESALAAKGLSDAQKVQSDTAAASAAKNDEAAASTTAVSDASDAGAVSLGKVGKVAGITALGLGIAAGVMVKAAGNFQDSTTHLVTDAGVSAKNLGMVQAGILQVSTATGQSAASITDAMYHIASSGFRAQNGLNILKVAAEGARIGGADLDTTSKALVGTMTAYYGTSLTAAQATKDSTSLMSQLVATVGSGDMRMQDLASSLSTVTPVAAAAGISFAQVGGAIATMTAQGMSAEQATQDLANTIRNLKSPNNVASQEMRALGLNANQVSQNLGKAGLAGTLNELRNAVLSNTSGGTVMLGYLKEMSPAAQGLANQIMAGSISTKALRTAVYSLNPEQAKLISLFEASATSATGLKQTYTGAMDKMLGGATGLNTALMLTGKHMGDLTKNTAAATAAGKNSAAMQAAWEKIQGTFNFKLAQSKTGIENTGIAIGSALLPAVSAIVGRVAKVAAVIAEWTAKHQKLTEYLFVSVTAIAALVAAISLATKAFKAVSGAVNSVKSVVSGTIGLFKKLGGAAKTSAAEQEAASGEAAAAAETDAAETAAANETAAAESSAGWITAAASTVAGWAASGARMIGQAAVWVAQNAVKVASVVAANVGGAAVTAGAWIAANAVMLLGIGLIIAAVVIAVVEIVKHWKQISAAAAAVWHDVTAAAQKAGHDILAAVDSVIKWVKGNWPLLLAILLGPIAVAALEIAKHWKQIKDGASDLLGDLERFFKGLPGKIWSALGDLGNMMFKAGKSAISMLISGLKSIPVIGTMVSIAGDIADHFPHSPAKRGPLSGSGSPDVAGRNIPRMLAAGMLAGKGTVVAASAQLAASAVLGHGGTPGTGSPLALSAIGPAGAAGGGNAYITVDMRGAHLMTDADMNAFLSKLGPVLNRSLAQAGRKINLR